MSAQVWDAIYTEANNCRKKQGEESEGWVNYKKNFQNPDMEAVVTKIMLDFEKKVP